MQWQRIFLWQQSYSRIIILWQNPSEWVQQVLRETDAFREIFFCSKGIHFYFSFTFPCYISMPPALQNDFLNPPALSSTLTTLLLLTFTQSPRNTVSEPATYYAAPALFTDAMLRQWSPDASQDPFQGSRGHPQGWQLS